MLIGCYGGETFGMSEARCKPIQSEIDKAIRLVANVEKSAAMERIRDELGITSAFMRTRTARECAYHKWPTSKNMDRRAHQDTNDIPNDHVGDRECPVDQNFLNSRFKGSDCNHDSRPEASK
ncbi:hypothetical protein AYI69_g8094 [Smittium culicis]|uniref:Uncharacterized protein n=1 Tax=Smittium culicis TaxID=133412 RepID=A0A1R1XM86_9FUNG|nr:hypothetical protein AYI69_g8094 [Smittium culicis]